MSLAELLDMVIVMGMSTIMARATLWLEDLLDTGIPFDEMR
jgi:hypothetical protein